MKKKQPPGILSIDVGGSGIKGAVISDRGHMRTERRRIVTPKPAPPRAVLKIIGQLARPFKNYNRVAIGFPGLVRDGVVYTAPNLGNKYWIKIPFQKQVEKLLKVPVRILNDAEVQGLSVIRGKGLELTVTLGTGFGVGIFKDGVPIPHLEISQHPISKGRTYDEYVGDIARREVKKKKWTRRVKKAMRVLKTVVNYDQVYIGGGNAKKLTGLPIRGSKIVQNKAGLTGAAALWKLKVQP
jgi:polyphosphate glucokinase